MAANVPTVTRGTGHSGRTRYCFGRGDVAGDVMFEIDVAELAESDENMLFDVPDDALERAAAVGNGQAVTAGFCS